MENNKILITLIFKGEDDWSRPIFKHIHSSLYFGSTNILIPDIKLGLVDEDSIIKYFNNNPEKIKYFGSRFDDDPADTDIPDKYEIVILSIKEARERRALLDKYVEKLERHQFAPELDKVILKNGAFYHVNGITDFKKAVDYVFRSVKWEQLKLNLK